MERLWGVRLALIVAALSVWVGFQVGLDRPWPASVFLFFIPVIVAVFSIRAWKRARHTTNVPNQKLAELANQVEQLSAQLGQVERKLDDILNLLSAQAALPGVGVNKHDQQ